MPTPDEEPSLIARARSGDEEAFGDLMREHHAAVFRLVVAIVRNEHDARDICQEVWIAVWRDLGKFRGEARFTTWLHPIATRRAIDHLRRRRRWLDRFLPFATSPEDRDGVPEPVAESSDPRQPVEQAERAARFESLLASLPPPHRAVLALREVEGLSYDEIAHALGCPRGTVMSRLHHARHLLAKKLKNLPCE